MFIVWGRKLVYRKFGYVADFCPICRSKEAFLIRRIGSASHVYYISFGEGDLVGYERVCTACRSAVIADINVYAAISKTQEPLEALTRQTYPDFEQALHERLALEQKLKDQPSALSEKERYDLILSPFLAFSRKVEQRFAESHIDWDTILAGFIAILMVAYGPDLLTRFFPHDGETVLLTFIGLGMALIIWQGARTGRRYMRRKILPGLAKSLQPLQPTDGELATLLADLRQYKHKIGRKVVIADLRRMLSPR